MRKRRTKARNTLYEKWSAQLRDQLVRCLDGNYYKITHVDGFAGHNLHIHTREGRSFWALKTDDGRYVEIKQEKRT